MAQTYTPPIELAVRTPRDSLLRRGRILPEVDVVNGLATLFVTYQDSQLSWPPRIHCSRAGLLGRSPEAYLEIQPGKLPRAFWCPNQSRAADEILAVRGCRSNVAWIRSVCRGFLRRSSLGKASRRWYGGRLWSEYCGRCAVGHVFLWPGHVRSLAMTGVLLQQFIVVLCFVLEQTQCLDSAVASCVVLVETYHQTYAA